MILKGKMTERTEGYVPAERQVQSLSKLKENEQFVNSVEWAELTKIKPKSCAASVKRLKLQPISQQQEYLVKALRLIETLGGRTEIQLMNLDEDTLISQRNMDVKYMGDRPSIARKKSVIAQIKNFDKRT